MGGREPLPGLHELVEDFGGRAWRALGPSAQRVAGYVLHDEHDVRADIDVVHGHDIGVIESCHRTRLADHPCLGTLVDGAGVELVDTPRFSHRLQWMCSASRTSKDGRCRTEPRLWRDSRHETGVLVELLGGGSPRSSIVDIHQ